MTKEYDTIDAFMEKEFRNMTDDLAEWAAIPSVMDMEHAAEGAPFGPAAARALDWVMEKAGALGFRTRNVDGYAVEIEAGDGEEVIGIMGHGDVVAAGEGWDTDPFAPVIRDGNMYGRGTSDDKGPLVSCLYAMKYLSESGRIPAGGKIRMIIGFDEEEGLRCIRHYRAAADSFPKYTIVPDANFPAIFCEKGLLDIDLSFRAPASHHQNSTEIHVAELSAGTGRNIAAPAAFCLLECGSAAEAVCEALSSPALDPDGRVAAERDGSRIRIRITGKSAHAMSPEKGYNAASRLMETLAALPARTDLDAFVQAYHCSIGMEYDGTSLGIASRDDLSGPLTVNIGTVSVTRERDTAEIALQINIRYPATEDPAEAEARILKGLENAGFRARTAEHMKPLCVDLNSDLMKILTGVYARDTGDTEHKPFSMGGATYARELPNAVAFGPLFPWEKELAHEANECLSLDSFRLMTKIYADALEELLGLSL